MRTLVDTLYDLWFDTKHTLSENEMTKILSSLTDTMSTLKDNTQLGSFSNAAFVEDQKHCFLQIWQLLAIYLVSEEEARSRFIISESPSLNEQIAKLAELTPSIAYDQEFQLQVRVGAKRAHLETFCQSVFQQFEAQLNATNIDRHNQGDIQHLMNQSQANMRS